MSIWWYKKVIVRHIAGLIPEYRVPMLARGSQERAIPTMADQPDLQPQNLTAFVILLQQLVRAVDALNMTASKLFPSTGQRSR